MKKKSNRLGIYLFYSFVCVWGIKPSVCVCVCVCVRVYVVYEDTNLYNDMGMT